MLVSTFATTQETHRKQELFKDLMTTITIVPSTINFHIIISCCTSCHSWRRRPCTPAPGWGRPRCSHLAILQGMILQILSLHSFSLHTLLHFSLHFHGSQCFHRPCILHIPHTPYIQSIHNERLHMKKGSGYTAQEYCICNNDKLMATTLTVS